MPTQRNMPYGDGNTFHPDSAFNGRQISLLDAMVLKEIVDNAGGGIQYIGNAECGTATSTAKWRIYRIVESGNLQTVEWADGNGLFDNIWDNRAALAYI